jgi:hypothetical protein
MSDTKKPAPKPQPKTDVLKVGDPPPRNRD